MTKENTINLLVKLNFAYPLFYSNKKAEDFAGVAEVWYDHLKEYDFKVIDKAAELMIGSETEVPTIALLKRYIPKAREQIRREVGTAPEEIERLRRLAR